jgi:hypothetical protein
MLSREDGLITAALSGVGVAAPQQHVHGIIGFEINPDLNAGVQLDVIIIIIILI